MTKTETNWMGSVAERSRPVDRAKAEKAMEDFIRALGFDPTCDALRDSARRATAAFIDVLTSGYEADLDSAVSSGFPIASDAPMIAIDIPVLFVCPHHLLPAQGFVHLGFAPNGKVPGLGQLAKLVDCFARRLVLQEELTQSLADTLVNRLEAKAAVAIVEATHGCMAVEDFARRDTRFRTHALAGDQSIAASLREEIGASLADQWRTSASEPRVAAIDSKS